MEAIRCQQLTRRFGGTCAVDALTLAVAPGELFGLVGPDGSGKTTTMRLLAAILPPSGGDAWVAGRHVAREAEAVKTHIGYMSQRFGLYPDLTVTENLSFYAEIHEVPRAARAARFERLLAFSNLAPFGDRQAGRLSGGMKQKLGLACALIHEPKILLLDEPTNGVDPVSRRDFWRILYQLLRQGVTIFVATSYLDEAERCARVALLQRGRLAGLGTPDEVKAHLHGALFELRVAKPREAARLLREGLPGAGVGLYGDRLHLLLHDPAQLPEAERLLAAAGLAPDSLRPIAATLEDVVVDLMQRDGGPAA